MVANTKTYTDINLNFEPHPVTGDVSMVYDQNSVIQSMTLLCLAAETEFLGQPGLGGGVNQMLFELNDGLMVYSLQSRLTEVISASEKRVELVSVTVSQVANNKGFNATIKFYMLNQPTATTATIQLNRLR